MKQPIQAFAIGLFTAGLTMLAGIYFFPASEDPVQSASTDELISIVEEEGYHVLTESEYISYSVQKDRTAQTADSTTDEKDSDPEEKDKEQEKDEADGEKKKVEETPNDSFTLVIEPGMTSSDISSELEDEGIVEDSKEFNQYLNKHDFSPYIQIGQFPLSSDMSFYEIAMKVTN